MTSAVSNKKQRSTRVGFYSAVLGVCWTCTVIVSLVWNLHFQHQETREVALNVARAYIQSDNSYRRWNALQGGIYIPAEKNRIHKLPADVTEQEIITPSGKHLVLAAHALMMDEIYELAGQDYIARGELKSLDPVTISDKADEWETAALNTLIKGEKEVGEVVTINGEQNFLLMQPCISSEIEQVMRNLIRNAAQAVFNEEILLENPKIVLRTRHEAQRNMVLIEVEDNGIGMDETVQRRVFEPFFTTKPPGEGTGLGLAVSYFLITVAHQGLMDVESEPGKGTLFSIRLPLS